MRLRGRVTDEANVFSKEAIREIDALLAKFERETCHQYVVVTVRDLQGLSIEDFSLSLANSNGVGHEGLNNGLTVLVAPNDRGARIEVGCGLESAISDPEAARVMRQTLIPAFRKQHYDKGILDGLRELMALGRAKPVPSDLKPSVCRDRQ